MAARIVRMGGYEWRGGQWVDDPEKKRTPASRANADRYKPLVRLSRGVAQWTGVFAFDPEKLSDPIRRKAPTMYFVNSMSDLFGEGLTNEQIAAVFGVMASCRQHTFQILTKRADRMVEWFRWIVGEGEELEASVGVSPPSTSSATGSACVSYAGEEVLGVRGSANAYSNAPWPMPNVWLGVSCERQQEADERIPLLLQCPAAVRWVSAEPLLGPINFGHVPPPDPDTGHRLSWVVFGGESGHGARPCDVEWIRDGLRQCQAANVRAFVKQLGAEVRETRHYAKGDTAAPYFGTPLQAKMTRGDLRLTDRKGADLAEWPEDLRVREWPHGFAPPKSKALPVVQEILELEGSRAGLLPSEHDGDAA